MATPTRRDHFVQAAVELITEQGAAALKVAPLCRRLDVTTGSFYHHFDGLGALVDAVLAAWEEASTRVVGAAVAQIAEADDAIAVLKHTSITLPHAFESRVRAWALRDAAVAQVQARVDAERVAVLTHAIGAMVGPDAAPDLAVLGFTILVGFQQSRDVGDVEELARLMEHYEQMIYATRERRESA